MLQNPPFCLDVFILVGDIGGFKVNPESDPVGQLFPFLNVCECRLTAELVEFGNAVILDLLLVGKTQLLLDFYFHRQPVGVPPAAAFDVETAHGLVAREHIFKCTRQHMMDARFSVRGWRSLVKNIRGAALALDYRLLKNIMAFPEPQHSLFHQADVQLGRNWFKHSSSELNTKSRHQGRDNFPAVPPRFSPE